MRLTDDEVFMVALALLVYMQEVPRIQEEQIEATRKKFADEYIRRERVKQNRRTARFLARQKSRANTMPASSRRGGVGE